MSCVAERDRVRLVWSEVERRLYGRSLSEVERDAGLSHGHLWHVRRRQDCCSVYTVDALANALGCHYTELML